MTDRELLELAAKAAGGQVRFDLSPDEAPWLQGVVDGRPQPYPVRWNPLTDDGDALRLMVKIGIRGYFGLEVQKPCVQATCFEPWEHCAYEEYKNQDPYAATRRALVRAAAEIGRSME